MSESTDQPEQKPPLKQSSRRGRMSPEAAAKRREARMLALQALYEIDVTSHPLDEVNARTAEDLEVEDSIRDHVIRLTRGVIADQETIDTYIANAAPAFPIPQIATVDRNILRVAVFELLHEEDVPVRAIINEAVELAKQFGGPSSGRFVNGVLGTLAERIRP